MKLEIISISNKLSKLEEEIIDFYLKQISFHTSLKIENIKPAQGKRSNIKEVQADEERRISKKIKTDSIVVSFDRNGKQFNSVQFADLINILISSAKDSYLIIGGSNGLSNSFLKKSDHVISFSALTFPHKLFKILLVEQIYRSISIMNNKPYHK